MTRIVKAIGELSAWGFAVIVVVIVIEVVLRYGFGRPTFWAHEIAGLLGALAFLLGGAYCMADGSHMRISLISDKLPRAMRLCLELLGHICGLIFLTGLAVSGWSLTRSALFRFMPDGTWFPERSGTSWNTPLPGLIKAALFAGAVLFLAMVLLRLWRLVVLREESYLPPPPQERHLPTYDDGGA